ncbi:MAG: tripartite tricarboxylate transporter substrate binding protein [Deltaproteobacteria bacterium]|nr:tripartite tricarboxylate transporter substrate binding protein [Deltaproteobacteria bacterium]
MKKHSIVIGICLLLLTAGIIGVTPAAAQDYPKGPIQLVVPFGSGGATDIFWRTMGDYFSKALKTTITIVNKPGGGGIVGMAGVLQAKPDGYTLCAGNSDTLDITPLFTKDLPFNTIDDVNYVVKVANFPQSIVVKTDSPFKTFEDVIAAAKANPKKLKASTPGVGTNPAMALRLLNYEAKADITTVAFSGGGESVTALLGGHVDLAAMALPAAKAQVDAGKIRILVFFSKERHPLYPNVPTSYEKGYKQTLVDTGMGIVGPKGLPPEVIKKWDDVIRAAVKDPAFVAMVNKFDFVPHYLNGAQYKKEIVDEFALFKKVTAANQ